MIYLAEISTASLLMTWVLKFVPTIKYISFVFMFSFATTDRHTLIIKYLHFTIYNVIIKSAIENYERSSSVFLFPQTAALQRAWFFIGIRYLSCSLVFLTFFYTINRLRTIDGTLLKVHIRFTVNRFSPLTQKKRRKDVNTRYTHTHKYIYRICDFCCDI